MAFSMPFHKYFILRSFMSTQNIKQQTELTMIENNISLNRYQILNVISRKKHAVIKLLNLQDNTNYCIKYVQVHCEQQIKFYQTVLSSINFAINTSKSKLTQTISYGLTPKENQRQYIWMKSVYICDQTLDNLFLNNMKLKVNSTFEQTWTQFKTLQPFRILDCIIDCIEINTIIINQSNLYVNPKDLLVNYLSFTGCDLIFFEKSISLKEFRSIYNFIHSNIFENQPFKRISHQQKLKNFAALFLTFIVGRPIGLLQNQKLPQVISLDIAKKIVKKSSELYKKYLNIEHIRSKIAEYSKFWNIDLHNFFEQMLVQQKDFSWSEIYHFFCRKDHIQTNSRFMLQQAVNDCWSKLSNAQKQYVYQKRYIRIDERQDISKVRLKIEDSSILLIKAMRIKLASLKNGSIFDELADKRNFDLLSLQLMKGLIYILNFDKQERMQSLEIHRQTGDDFHLTVFRILDSLKESNFKLQDDCHTETTLKIVEKCQQQQTQWMEQTLAQGKQQHVKQQVKRVDCPKQSILELVINSYKQKLKFQTKQQDKQIRIDHLRLKGLKSFQNAFK